MRLCMCVCVCVSSLEPDERRDHGNFPVELNPRWTKPQRNATLHQREYHATYPNSNALGNFPPKKKKNTSETRHCTNGGITPHTRDQTRCINFPLQKKSEKRREKETKYPRSKGLWNSISFAPSWASSSLFLTAKHFFVLTFFFCVFLLEFSLVHILTVETLRQRKQDPSFLSAIEQLSLKYL